MCPIWMRLNGSFRSHSDTMLWYRCDHAAAKGASDKPEVPAENKRLRDEDKLALNQAWAEQYNFTFAVGTYFG